MAGEKNKTIHDSRVKLGVEIKSFTTRVCDDGAYSHKIEIQYTTRSDAIPPKILEQTTLFYDDIVNFDDFWDRLENSGRIPAQHRTGVKNFARVHYLDFENKNLRTLLMASRLSQKLK